MAAKMTSRYFKSFSATTYPVEPVNEIDRTSAKDLSTYYEAKFDARGLLRRFVKHLKQRRANDKPAWKTMFVEEYDYYPSGNLKERRLKPSGAEPRSWRFDDKPPAWSKNIDAFVSSWFAESDDSRAIEDMQLADRLVICHELMSEMENAVFETIAQEPRDAEWAYTNLTSQLPSFKDMIELIVADSNPRILMLKAEPPAIAGFDDVPEQWPIHEIIDTYMDRRFSTPQRIILDDNLITRERKWFCENQVKSLFVMPIRAIHEREVRSVGDLSLILNRECNTSESAATASIFKRIGHLCQITIEFARSNQPFEQIDIN